MFGVKRFRREVLDSLERIERHQHQLLKGERYMAGELEKLQQDVAAEGVVVDGAITLIKGIKAALDAAIAAGDPAALTALSAEIEAKTAALSAAVVENTPATP